MHESRLASARLYLCTDARRERGDLAQFAEAALAGGVDIIQLRDKGSPGELRFGPLLNKAECTSGGEAIHISALVIAHRVGTKSPLTHHRPHNPFRT